MGMEQTHSKIDMLHGSIWNKLPRYALPVAATAILEQLFNASDIVIFQVATKRSLSLRLAQIALSLD